MSEKRVDGRDKAWKFTKKMEEEKYFRCVFCNQVCSGTISKFKHHLAGISGGMKACNKVPSDMKNEYQLAIKDFKDLKFKRCAMLRELGEGIGGGSDSIDSPLEECGSSATQLKVKGPLDSFVSSQPRQTVLNEAYKKELRKEVCRMVGRFMFSRVLPFNTINDPFWLAMVEGIAKYGVGFKPPSMHELRTWILREEVEDIDKYLLEHKKAWEKYWCSIMSDYWTDGKSRRIGEENVVQIITNNASNYKNAGLRLMQRMLKLWWTPCAAHSIDLMLEDISKLIIFKKTIASAKKVVKFLYGHTWVISLMREFTNNSEIIRPTIQTKKKDRLEHKRLNALVYVKYNSLLMERNIRRRVKKLDPILVEEIDSDDEWISEVEDPILPDDLSWLEEEPLDEPTIDDVPLSDDDMRFDQPSYAHSSKMKNVESSTYLYEDLDTEIYMKVSEGLKVGICEQ
ncbi:uncharacterized protein LOC126803624 [Argentina anserina]|uniref:uncharacterized protein LOC126803624 n=1 Tax=Argentina anserina TaxID=57926 RepID=UPI00217644A8|nr:uncharacterized protein LOC126803624 [Potentilla anserina]